MMEALKVAVVLPDEGGVGHYRLQWPAEAVAEKTGWDIIMYGPRDLKIAEEPKSFLAKGPDDELINLKDLDLFVMSRPPAPKHVRFLSHLQRLGVAVVVDLDDDLSQIHPKSSAWKSWNGKRTHWKNAEAACQIADVVTCSTKAIERRFAKHGRYAILNNRIPDHLVKPEVSDEEGPFTLLWSGHARGHEGDLEMIGDALKRLGDVKVRVVGPADHVAQRLGISEDQVSGVGWTKFTDWHDRLNEEVAHADVGIVPLGLTRFNQAKSWLKGIEFLNAGLPVVASPTAEYVRLAKMVPHQVAIAKTPDQWFDLLGTLKARREQMTAGAAREAAQSEFEAARGSLVLSEGVDGWINAWERAVNRRRGLKR